MHNPLFSIVIPIYNVENYLRECLDSIVYTNSFKDYEIICIDDCSPDNSSSIVLEYQKKYSNIKLIKHSKNLGLGGARNTGISNSNGDYIIFLDSDDYLSPDSLSLLSKEINRNNFPDILLINYNEYDEKTKKITKDVINFRFKTKTYYTKDVIDYEEIPDVISAWSKIAKRELYDNFNFLIHTQAEDIPTYYLFTLAKDLLILNTSIYNYRANRPGSIITETSIKMHKGAILNTNHLLNLFEKDNISIKYQKGLSFMTTRIIDFGHFTNYFNSLSLIQRIIKSPVFYKVLSYSKYSDNNINFTCYKKNILLTYFLILKKFKKTLNLTSGLFIKKITYKILNKLSRFFKRRFK